MTHELAQLLAASIAQNQANRGAAGGIPTNSELTSLANLVSATSSQRTLAPVFKDGLSALSYVPVHPRNAPTPEHESEQELHHDDEPMPIPSTWREPSSHDEQRWFRQQMGAAFLGLIAGLAIVVPAVLWMSGWLGPQGFKFGAPSQVAAQLAAKEDGRAPEIKTVKVQMRQIERPPESAAQFVTGSVDARSAVESRRPYEQASAPTPPAAETRGRGEDVLAQATHRVGSGDVIGARELLASADDGVQASISFALAETFDPNMLAAWGSRGVAADAARARALYRKALELGMGRAQVRLDALK